MDFPTRNISSPEIKKTTETDHENESLFKVKDRVSQQKSIPCQNSSKPPTEQQGEELPVKCNRLASHSFQKTLHAKETPTRSSRRDTQRVKRSQSAVLRGAERHYVCMRRSFSEQGKESSHRHSFRGSRPITTRSKSLTETIAIEMGGKDVPGMTVREARRRRIVLATGLVALVILGASLMLVAITLLLTPAVDDFLAKQNEEIFRSMSAAGNTAPPTEGAPVNDTVTSNGQPG